MRRDLPQWLISDCDHWGHQKLRILIGRDVYRDTYVDHTGRKQVDLDGYANSLLGRIREERDGAGQGHLKQHWPEVLHGRALEIQRIISTPPLCLEIPHLVGHLHYIIPKDKMTVVEKAKVLKLSKPQYWRELENWEFFLLGRLDSPSACKSSENILQPCPKTPTVRRIPAKVAKASSIDINLGALNRRILTLAE